MTSEVILPSAASGVLTSLRRWKRYPAYRDSGVDWLGEIPKHWAVKRLKNIAVMNPDSLGETTPPDYQLLYVDITGVDSSGKVLGTEDLHFADAPTRARRRVKHGDTIISTVRTYLKAIALISQPPDNLIVSTGFAVLRPCGELHPNYLSRLVQAEPFIQAVVAQSEGVGYPAISPSRLASLRVWHPPLPEQRAIADFLDLETAKIDALVAKRERLIDLLQEKRAAVIAHAVTKGLDPNAPMKDSGIASLGKIPAHWEVRRNKQIFREVDERSATGEEELLTVSHITGVTSRSEKEVNMFLAESMEGYKKVRKGDLVVNTMWAWMGALGISGLDGIVSPSYNVYRASSGYEPMYLDFLYRTPPYVCEIGRYSKGVWTSRLRLYPDEFFDIATITPPLSEQKAIVAHIAAEIQPIDALIAEVRAHIDKLREFRMALISAVVTGKIDVRHEVK